MSLILTSIATVTMIAASAQDLKHRKVSHLTWIPLLLIAVAFLATGAYDKFHGLPSNWFAGYLINILINIAAGLVMIYLLRRFYGMGGADIMALLCLCIAYATTAYFILVVVAVCVAGMALVRLTAGRIKIPLIVYIFAGYLVALVYCGGI